MSTRRLPDAKALLRQARPCLQLRHQLVPLRHARGLASPANDRVAVVGGGLTGLTTAYYLAKNLPSTTKITLFEGSDRLGGWIQTDRVPLEVDGHEGVVTFERGPRTLSSLKGNTWRHDDLVLYDLMLDLGLDAVFPKDLPRLVYYPDHIVQMPPDASLLECAAEPLFWQCIPGALSVMIRLMFGKSPGQVPDHDVSVADFLRSLTGGDVVGNNLASAMIHGIYGGDIEKLSARYTLEKMWYRYHMPAPEPGHRYVPAHELELIRHMHKTGGSLMKSLASKPVGSLIHFGAQGMEALPKALAKALSEQSNVSIRRSDPVSSIAFDHKHGQVEIQSANMTQSFDRVISTTSAHVLHNSAPKTLPSLSQAKSVSIMTVNIWYPLQDMKRPGFGYLIPKGVPEEQNPERALGVFFDSDVIPQGAPDELPGTKLFVLMGGHYYEGREPPSEEEAIEQAKAVLERHLGIPQDAPCHAVARLAKDCIPQHNVGHADMLRKTREELLGGFHSRLTVANGSYGRIGALGALRNGFHAAQQLLGGDDPTGLNQLLNIQSVQAPVSQFPFRQFKKQ